MKVDFDVEKEHLIDFSLHNIKNSKEIKRIVKVQRYLTPFAFLFFALLIGAYRNDFKTWLLVFVGMYIAWVALYPKIYMASVRKSVKKNIEELNGKKDKIGHCRLIIKDDGLVEESNVRTNKTKWEDLVRLVETDEYMFVYNTDNSAYVIPKDRFENEEYGKEYIQELANKTHKEVEQWA